MVGMGGRVGGAGVGRVWVVGWLVVGWWWSVKWWRGGGWCD